MSCLMGRICRTCLLESPTMHKLLDVKDDKLIEDVLNKTIPNNMFFENEQELSLPVEICSDCLEKLYIAYDFQQMCMANNEKLRTLIKLQETEDILVPETGGESDQDILQYGTEELNDNCDMQSMKSELEDEFCSSEVQNAFDILVDSSKEDVDILEEQQIDEVKIEIEAMDNLENEFLEAENKIGDETNHDEDEYWPNDLDNNGNAKAMVTKNRKTKLNRKYVKRISSKATNNNKTCLQCNKTFNKRAFLTRHMSVHNEENTFVCHICDYRFSTEKLLKVHISYKHNRGVAISLAGGPYQCPDCPMVFEETRALSAHRVMHSERDFKCKVCGVNLKTLSAVTRHMNQKHPGVLPYKCEMCEKAFPVETHYNDHLNMHKGYKKHKCEMCDKSFPNSTALKDHMRSHTGESPYLCSHCGKSFKTSNILRQHLQRHGEKNFQCPECPMRFYAKVNLQKHMCTHSKEKPFVCDICGSSFTRGDSLKAHRFKHTGERPFKCEECNMSFVFKRHWMRHKITHTGEKPHMCTYCDRSYAASGDLVKHLRTHLGENTYFCDECPLTFKYQHDLRDHKNQHYKEKAVNLETVDKDVS